MPSLLDTLANLNAQSEQIIHLSTHNYRSSGPFAQAYLGTPDVLSLIRDAEPSEARLFKFIGEEGSGNKKVEKRDGGVVTPLKEFKAKTSAEGKDGNDQVGVMLKTAMTLVEDYRPGPRAKAHTQRLVDAHIAQSERVAELERLIQEATEGISNTQALNKSSNKSDQSERSVAERIKAEEAALRNLEALIAPHRPPPIPTDSSPPAPSASHSTMPRSPSPPMTAPPAALYARTPAKTPQNMPHIANSLVNGMTPRRAPQTQTQPLNRFSPLKLMGTPRAPVGGSRLRDDDDNVGRNIFSRASILRNSSSSVKRSTNVLASRSQSRSPEKEPMEDETDQTVRFGQNTEGSASPEKDAESASLFSPIKPEVPAEESADDDTRETTPRQSPVKPMEDLPAEPLSSKVEGVDLDLAWVQKATNTVHSSLSEMMRQGRQDDSQAEADPESVIRHLYLISQSDPAPPPSPSTSSSISTLSSVTKAPPITADTILLSHLLLMLFRSEEGDITVQSAKENLGAIARARGWVEGDERVSKVIYTAVGKRTIKIDRRVAGGKIVFV